MAKLLFVEETNQVGVSLDAHLQVLAPHAEAVRAVAARRSLAARRAASRPVIGIVERRKEVATLFFLQQNAVAALVVVFVPGRVGRLADWDGTPESPGCVQEPRTDRGSFGLQRL